MCQVFVNRPETRDIVRYSSVVENMKVPWLSDKPSKNNERPNFLEPHELLLLLANLSLC